jgi:oligosaccharide repeat unit polymerase
VLRFLIPLILTVAVAVSFLLSRHWATRLSPLVFVGGAHLIYNSWSIAAARIPTERFQYLCLALSYATFVAGVLAVGILWKRNSSPQHRSVAAVPLEIRTFSTVALFVISAAVYGWLVVRAGAPPLLAGDASSARLSFFANGYEATVVVTGLQAVVMATGWTFLQGQRKIFSAVLALAALLILISTANRGMAALPALVLMVSWAYRKGPRPYRFVALAVCGLVALSVTGYLRNRAAFGPTYDRDLATAGFSGPGRFFGPLVSYLAGTSETFDRTIHVFPSALPFQHGVQFFSPLLHHESVDLYLKHVFGLNFEGFGLALGAMNAFYLDWGIAGIAAGFLLLGVFLAYLYRRGQRDHGYWEFAWVLASCGALLANYGHPFAYISTVATPVVSLLLLAPQEGGPFLRRFRKRAAEPEPSEVAPSMSPAGEPPG